MTLRPKRPTRPPVSGVSVPMATSDAAKRLRVDARTLNPPTDPMTLPEKAVPASILDLVGPALRDTLEQWLGAPGPADHLLLVIPDGFPAPEALLARLADAPGHAAYDVVYAYPPGEDVLVPLTLPAGDGPRFIAAAEAVIAQFGPTMYAALGAADAAGLLSHVDAGEAAGQAAALAELERAARRAGYLIRGGAEGLTAVPLLHGKPLSPEQIGVLDRATRRAVGRAEDHLSSALARSTARVRDVGAATDAARAAALDPVVATVVKELTDTHFLPVTRGSPAAAAWGEQLGRWLAARWAAWTQPEPCDAEPIDVEKARLTPILFVTRPPGHPIVWSGLGLNDALLLGGVELAAPSERPRVWPGTIHQAAGGFLLLDLTEAHESPERWQLLQSMLRTGVAAAPGPGRPLPPAPADARVILLARPGALEFVEEDPALQTLVPVRLELGDTVPRTPSSTLKLDGWFAARALSFGWGRLDREARALTIDLAVRLTGRHDQLPLATGPLEEVLAFAAGDAAKASEGVVTAGRVRAAWHARLQRLSPVERQVRAMTTSGEVKVETSGSRVGVVNGLAVLEHGGVAFGHPVRITAVVSIGRDGIIDVERESELGGAIHTKGVAILRGYFSKIFGQRRPLSLRAQLVVEQSYGGIEGDSAAAAELFAVLSELAGVPLAQHRAVTGSVNQLGEIQAIGGVTAKIEGFFDVCAERGLTGDQGVIFPRVNLRHLVLREDVVAAIGAGRFHLWPIERVEEGVGVLTGLEAGERDLEGHFPAASVFGRVERRLVELAEHLRASEMYPVEGNEG